MKAVVFIIGTTIPMWITSKQSYHLWPRW